MKLQAVTIVNNLYVDACVYGEDAPLFISLWGTETSIREFTAKVTLNEFNGCYFGQKYILAKALNLLSTRTCRLVRKDSVFADKVHLWLYDERTCKPCYASQSAVLLKLEDEPLEAFEERLWQMVQHLCPVPLLSEWQKVISYFYMQKWILRYFGQGVDAYELRLDSAALEPAITRMVQEGILTITK